MSRSDPKPSEGRVHFDLRAQHVCTTSDYNMSDYNMSDYNMSAPTILQVLDKLTVCDAFRDICTFYLFPGGPGSGLTGSERGLTVCLEGTERSQGPSKGRGGLERRSDRPGSGNDGQRSSPQTSVSNFLEEGHARLDALSSSSSSMFVISTLEGFWENCCRRSHLSGFELFDREALQERRRNAVERRGTSAAERAPCRWLVFLIPCLLSKATRIEETVGHN
ncbi:uncharacterized protein V6R79_008666 [Siganus canaliculatus]